MKNFIFLFFLLGCIHNAFAMEGLPFTSILDISANLEDFANLSLDDLEKNILQNENFKTDSENSMFAALMYWVKQQKQRKFPPSYPNQLDSFSSAFYQQKNVFVDIYLRPLLRFINFSELSADYLSNIVPSYLSEYDPQIYIDIINRAGDENHIRRQPLRDHDHELEMSRLKNWQKEQKYCGAKETNLNSQNPDKKVTATVTLSKLSEWKKQQYDPDTKKDEPAKYYSQKINGNGYEFYVFLRAEQDGVAMYVRCMGSTLNNIHLLPAQVKFSVVSSSNPNTILRAFPSINVNFDHFDRSFGILLTEKDKGETWENFTKGKTVLTENYTTDQNQLDNRITVEMELQFFDQVSPSLNELPFTLNLDDLNLNPATINVSEYILAVIEKKLLIGNPANKLLQMLLHLIKAEEAKLFPGESFLSAASAQQKAFIENYLKPIIRVLPFHSMSPDFFDNQVKSFMEHYLLTNIYDQIKTSYDEARPMAWENVRTAWAEWHKIKTAWNTWQASKESFIKENPNAPFTIPQPFFPPIAKIISTLNIEFPTDSEESILYLVLDYANEINKRADVLKKPSDEEWKRLWKCIEWNAINQSYFYYIRGYVEKINNPLLNHFYRDEALRRTQGGKIDPGTRSKIKDPHNLSLLCTFSGISTWQAYEKKWNEITKMEEEKGKYYSTPTLAMGYKIYYFLQRKRTSKPEEPETFGLAAFLRVMLQDNPNSEEKQDIDLPLTFNFAIRTPTGTEKERRFAKILARFTQTVKATGGIISLENETWDQIIKGNSPIVGNDIMQVILSLDFNTDGIDPEKFIAPQ